MYRSLLAASLIWLAGFTSADAEITVIDARGTVEMTASGDVQIKDLVLVLKISIGQGAIIRPPTAQLRPLPGPGPNPGPPDPGYLGFTALANRSVMAISDPAVTSHALRVRAVYRFLETQIRADMKDSAGRVDSFPTLAEQTRNLTATVLNGAGHFWEPLLDTIGKRITELRNTGRLVTVSDMASVYRAIADGVCDPQRERHPDWELILGELEKDYEAF